MSYQLGTNASEPLAFYGGTPVTRPTASAQAAVTDSSGGTAAPTTGVAATAFKETILIPLGAMSLIADTIAWKVAIPYAFTISSVLFRADVPITTGAKAVTLTTGIAATPCTGGVIAVAGAYATGATQAGDAVTALNVGAAGDTINIVASATTTFIEGTGHVEVTIINNARANAAATQIALTNALRAALVSLNLIKGS